MQTSQFLHEDSDWKHSQSEENYAFVYLSFI